MGSILAAKHFELQKLITMNLKGIRTDGHQGTAIIIQLHTLGAIK